jgi:hypothetical protein
MPYGPVSHPVQLHFVKYIVVLQPHICRNKRGLGFFPFARHYSGNHYCFLFLCLLRCFSSAGLRFMQYTFSILGFPIRKSADQFIFANPRSLSQLITSFIASESQGIPRVPFLTFFYACRFCSAWYALFSSYFVISTKSSVFSIKTYAPLPKTYNLTLKT